MLYTLNKTIEGLVRQPLTHFMKQKACIFIDLPNLIHSLTDLFANTYELQGNLTVIKTINFQNFFDKIIGENNTLVRAYIYSAKDFLFIPDEKNLETVETFKQIFLKNCKNKALVKDIRNEIEHQCTSNLLELQYNKSKKKYIDVKNQFIALNKLKHRVCTENNKTEFSKFGEFRYDIVNCEYKPEKGVDVNLAVDMIRLVDIYDSCFLVSGDQDFLPALQLIKDKGKTVYIIEFVKRNNNTVHSVSPRLKECADGIIRIKYQDAEECLRNPIKKSHNSRNLSTYNRTT